MPSSISNSNSNTQSWYLSWLLIAIICGVSLGGYEYFLKNRGFTPSIEQNMNLWSWYRAKIHGNKEELVIVGASRSQLDINIPYLKKKLADHDVTQLSINGLYPLATLKAIADDQDFIGTLIVAFSAQALETRYLDMQSEYNQYYADQSSFNKSFDAYLSALLQSEFRFLHPLLGMQEVVEFYEVNKKFQDVYYTTAHLDQSVSGDYTKTDTVALLKHFVKEKAENYKNEPPTGPQLWGQNVELIRSYFSAVKNRGGNVIFVRFPTDKGHWQLDEKYYPRKQYWDQIGRKSGVAMVHFNDVEGLNEIDLPDSSHVDQKDTIEFTEILFNYLIDNGYMN